MNLKEDGHSPVDYFPFDIIRSDTFPSAYIYLYLGSVRSETCTKGYCTVSGGKGPGEKCRTLGFKGRALYKAIKRFASHHRSVLHQAHFHINGHCTSHGNNRKFYLQVISKVTKSRVTARVRLPLRLKYNHM